MYGMSGNNLFFEGDLIKQYDINTGRSNVVGYSNKAYGEALTLAEEYKSKLEEAGIIEKELSPEELVKKQSKMIDKLLSTIEKQENKIESQDKRISKLETGLGVENEN